LTETDRIEVALFGGTVYLKPIGFATQNNCLGVPDFLKGMLSAGCRYIAFDLSECKGIDSTFLGVVANAALSRPQARTKTVLILNASRKALTLLRRVGLLPLVHVCKGKVETPEGLALRPIDFVHFPGTERERLRRIMELHRELCGLNEKNRRNFGPFVAMLKEELEEDRRKEKRSG